MGVLLVSCCDGLRREFFNCPASVGVPLFGGQFTVSADTGFGVLSHCFVGADVFVVSEAAGSVRLLVADGTPLCYELIVSDGVFDVGETCLLSSVSGGLKSEYFTVCENGSVFYSHTWGAHFLGSMKNMLEANGGNMLGANIDDVLKKFLTTNPQHHRFLPLMVE